MSNGRLSEAFCRWQGGRLPENSPAQRDSEISKLGVPGILRILGGKTKNENGSHQRDSKNSNLDFPLCLAGCQASPAMRDASVVKAVQRDSGISKLGTMEQVIITVSVKNNKPFFPLCLCDLVINTLPQRYSKMSISKTETENSLPQRHSKMSNGRLSGVSCWPHGQRAMFIHANKEYSRLFYG